MPDAHVSEFREVRRNPPKTTVLRGVILSGSRHRRQSQSCRRGSREVQRLDDHGALYGTGSDEEPPQTPGSATVKSKKLDLHRSIRFRTVSPIAICTLMQMALDALLLDEIRRAGPSRACDHGRYRTSAVATQRGAGTFRPRPECIPSVSYARGRCSSTPCRGEAEVKSRQRA